MQSFLDLHYPVDVKWAEVDGMRIAYADQGSGEVPLVLIHGLSGYIPMWAKNIGALAQRHRVIALDLPGYGKSDKPRASYSMRFFAETVRGLLDALEIPAAVLVGHSMGAQVSMHLALQAPARVSGLVLSSPAGIETFGAAESAFIAALVTPGFTRYATKSTIRARHEANFHRMPDDAGFMVSDRIAIRTARKFRAYCHVIKHSVRGMLNEPVHADLGRLNAPTLILFGEHDKLIPNPVLHRGTAADLVRAELPRMRRAELALLPNAGHIAQFEAPEAWNTAVLDFVGRVLPDLSGRGRPSR